MAAFRRGSFFKDIEVPGGDGETVVDFAERRYAWRLYIEMTTRRAVCGDPKVAHEPSFQGEVFAHSLESLKEFESELRNLVTSAGRNVPEIPLNRLADAGAQILEIVISPFIEKWHAPYLLWWDRQDDSSADLLERQKQFPPELSGPMKDEWRELKTFCRLFCAEIASTYDLISIFDMVPDACRDEWQEELASVWEILGEKTAKE